MQTSARGQYGHVVLRLIVDGPDAGITIENALPSGAIPAEYIPANHCRLGTACGSFSRMGRQDFVRVIHSVTPAWTADTLDATSPPVGGLTTTGHHASAPRVRGSYLDTIRSAPVVDGAGLSGKDSASTP
jgi:hypothetical protein